jgi:hypothetical protein
LDLIEFFRGLNSLGFDYESKTKILSKVQSVASLEVGLPYVSTHNLKIMQKKIKEFLSIRSNDYKYTTNNAFSFVQLNADDVKKLARNQLLTLIKNEKHKL